MIRVETENGLMGYGECAPWPPLGVDQATTLDFVTRRMGPILVGQDVRNINLLMSRLDELAPGNVFARAGLEMALYDMVGKSLNVSVSALLGGRLRDRIQVTALVSLASPQEMSERAAAAKELGFRCVKLKLGADKALEVERVIAVRQAVGSDIALRVDPNGVWSVPMTLEILRALESQDLEMLEQPVPREDLFGLVKLSQSTAVPILVDESVFNARDAALVLRMGFTGIVNVKVDEAGGVREAMKVIELCSAMGTPVLLGSMITTAIGSAASLHVAAVAPGLAYASDIVGSSLLVSDLARPPLRAEEGHIAVPTGPGLGIEVDEQALERFASS
jgi:muconate cycloisomerase